MKCKSRKKKAGKKADKKVIIPDWCYYYAQRICRTTKSLIGLDATGRIRSLQKGTLVVTGSPMVIVGSCYAADKFVINIRTIESEIDRSQPVITIESVNLKHLKPEPGVAYFDIAQAAVGSKQGWDIFYCAGSSGPLWQLQAIDEEGIFADDMEAQQFVWDQAVVARDPVALAALTFLYYRSPREYEYIRDSVTEPEIPVCITPKKPSKKKPKASSKKSSSR